uniref:Pipecolic acid oxidase n=1 Tax=Sinocyclocheilus grahami TaxID=75366 RepID=A0A672ST49_SINGR
SWKCHLKCTTASSLAQGSRGPALQLVKNKQKTLLLEQRVFQSSGGVIKDGEKVIDITPGAVVTVTTGSGVYGGGESSDHSGTLGHHSTHTGLPLLLKVVKISVCYWKEKIPGTYSVGQRFPCFIEMEPEEGEYDIYGLPSNEYPGLMKVTPDRNFVLDSHSTYGNTIIGAGFSGHGFKFGPIIGKLLSQLAMGQVPSYDLSPFRIQHFQSCQIVTLNPRAYNYIHLI